MRRNREFVFEIDSKFVWIMVAIGLIIVPFTIFVFNPSWEGLIILGINLITLLYYYTCIMQAIFKRESLADNLNPNQWIFFGYKVKIPKSRERDNADALYEIGNWFEENTKNGTMVRTVNNENVFVFQDEQDLMRFIMVWGDKLR